MRIGVIGTHCVGKTTIVEELQQQLPDYEFYSEPYYQLEDQGFIFSAVPTVDDYIEQFDYSAKQILESGENAIFDRCPIDLFAYIQASGALQEISIFYRKIENMQSDLDLLIFVPIEEPDRIVCSELPDLRFEVNEIIYDLIETLDIKTIKVNGDISQRINQIKVALTDLLLDTDSN